MPGGRGSRRGRLAAGGAVCHKGVAWLSGGELIARSGRRGEALAMARCSGTVWSLRNSKGAVLTHLVVGIAPVASFVIACRRALEPRAGCPCFCCAWHNRFQDARYGDGGRGRCTRVCMLLTFAVLPVIGTDCHLKKHNKTVFLHTHRLHARSYHQLHKHTLRRHRVETIPLRYGNRRGRSWHASHRLAAKTKKEPGRHAIGIPRHTNNHSADRGRDVPGAGLRVSAARPSV